MGTVLFSDAFVFFPRGKAAADVPLCLVFLQDLSSLQVEGAVEVGQPLGDIFMYRGFADAEFTGGSAHGGAVFDDVGGQIAGPLFHVPFDSSPLPNFNFHWSICTVKGKKYNVLTVGSGGETEPLQRNPGLPFTAEGEIEERYGQNQ